MPSNSDPTFLKNFSLETPVRYISSLKIDEKSQSLFDAFWKTRWLKQPLPLTDPLIKNFINQASTLGQDNKTWVKIQYINPSKGHGVFAAQPIPENRLLTLYAGVLTHNSFLSMRNRYLFCFQELPYFMINAQEESNWARFINHGDEEFCNLLATAHYLETGPFIILHTKKCIQPGEELLINYGSDYWAHHPKLPLPNSEKIHPRFNVHKDQFKALAKLTQRK